MRKVNFQVRLTEDERAIYESVARIKTGGHSLAEYFRQIMQEQYEAVDWYEEGLLKGEAGHAVFPVHDGQDVKDYLQGFAEGSRESFEEEAQA